MSQAAQRIHQRLGVAGELCVPSHHDAQVAAGPGLVHVHDGEGALALLVGSTPALAVLDMNMPVMDGYATAAAIPPKPAPMIATFGRCRWVTARIRPVR